MFCSNTGKLEEFNGNVDNKVDPGELTALGETLQSGGDITSVIPTIQKLMQWPAGKLYNRSISYQKLITIHIQADIQLWQLYGLHVMILRNI